MWAEYDFLPNLTGYAAYGFRDGKEENVLANLTVQNVNGNGTEYRFDNVRRNIIHTGEVGVKGSFATGAVDHEVVLAANRYQEKRKMPMSWTGRILLPPIYIVRLTLTALAIPPRCEKVTILLRRH